MRAVGESPQTADAVGISVTAYRYAHVVAGGALAGIGGACFSLALTPSWVDGLTGGAGWIAIALVIFAFWRPELCLVGAYFFGAFQALPFILQARGVTIAPELFQALPYVMTIVVLVIVSSGIAKRRLGAPGRARSTVRARGTLMDVHTPHTLDEALRLKAELPDARFVQGGTDVLVELNFDRSRPPALINLNEVAELRGFSRENGTVVLGSGLTYAEAMRGAVAEELPALAEASRTVGSPQIRNRGTIGGNLGTASPAGDALPPLLVEDAEVQVASVRGETADPAAGLPARREAERARARRAHHGRARRAEPGGADVHEGGAAERDGDLRLLPRPARRPRARRAARGVRLGGPDRAARHGAARRGRELPRARRREREPDRRRARHCRLPPACSRGAHPPRAREVPRMKIELTVNGERRETDVWGGESLLFALREQLGLPGSKNACEQGECGSCSVLLDGKLVCSCLVLAAQADGHEVVTVEGVAVDGTLHRVQEAFVAGGRRAVRVLHAGPDRGDGRPAGAHAEPDGRRDPRGALGQPLPLHRLPEDLRRGQGGGAAMTEVQTVNGSPYSLVEGGDYASAECRNTGRGPLGAARWWCFPIRAAIPPPVSSTCSSSPAWTTDGGCGPVGRARAVCRAGRGGVGAAVDRDGVRR